MTDCRNPANIFEQIILGIEAVNGNVVDLSKEIVEIRRDLDSIKRSLAPMPKSAGTEGDEDSAE